MKKKREPFTLLAPVDAAFAELSPKVYEILFTAQGKFLVAAILEQHLIPKSCLHCDDLESVKSISTMYGNELTIKKDHKCFYVTDSQILGPEIEAANGIVLAIDKLLPIRREAISGKKTAN